MRRLVGAVGRKALAVGHEQRRRLCEVALERHVDVAIVAEKQRIDLRNDAHFGGRAHVRILAILFDARITSLETHRSKR